MNTAQRVIILGIAGFAAVAGITVGGPAGGAQAASAAAACNSYAATSAGQGMECSVIVDNYIDNGVDDYSTVTVKECHGAAFTVLDATQCLTTVIYNTDATNTVTQCNGTLNGGGSNVTCTVLVNNYFSGAATPAFATLNQCIGSGAGGTSPTGPPLNCSPQPLTIGATVTQCNGSVNGGGGPLRVNCDMPLGAETAWPVTVNQCNGTVNAGGSVLFCSASFTNTAGVTLPGVPTTPPPAPAQSASGGTYGTPGGPSLTAGRFIAAPAALVPAAAGAALALSGTDSTVPLIAGCVLVALGAGAFLLGRRRIHHPAHRMG